MTRCPGCGSPNIETCQEKSYNNWDRHCKDCDLLFNLERFAIKIQVYRNNQEAEKISTSVTEETLSQIKRMVGAESIMRVK